MDGVYIVLFCGLLKASASAGSAGQRSLSNAVYTLLVKVLRLHYKGVDGGYM